MFRTSTVMTSFREIPTSFLMQYYYLILLISYLNQLINLGIFNAGYIATTDIV